MYLLLSGEGKGDIGACSNAVSRCDSEEFSEGPMAEVIFQLIENSPELGSYSFDRSMVGFVSEAFLVANKQAVISRKKFKLTGKKRPAETKYFFENARSLASVHPETGA